MVGSLVVYGENIECKSVKKGKWHRNGPKNNLNALLSKSFRDLNVQRVRDIS